MQEISELERRIAAAFDRIDRGLEQADRARAAVVNSKRLFLGSAVADRARAAAIYSTQTDQVDPAQSDSVQTESAQMEAILRSLERAQSSNAEWAQRYALLEAQMKETKLSMAGEIAKLSEELATKSSDPIAPKGNSATDQTEEFSQERLVLERQLSDLHGQLALQSAELTQLRAQRAAEIAELSAIVAALTPLMEEAKPYA